MWLYDVAICNPIQHFSKVQCIVMNHMTLTIGPEDPFAEITANSRQDIECDTDDEYKKPKLDEVEDLIFGQGQVDSECVSDEMKRSTGYLLLKFTFLVPLSRSCSSRSCFLRRLYTLRPTINRIKDEIASGNVSIIVTDKTNTSKSVTLGSNFALTGSGKSCSLPGSIIKNNQCCKLYLFVCGSVLQC